MRIAYADPPYIGQAKLYKKYRKDGHIAEEVDHTALIAQLQEYDGWALSCSSPSLHLILPLCPPKTRIAAFTRKGGGKLIAGQYPLYAWEPVLFMPLKRKQPRGILLDWHSSDPWIEARNVKRVIVGRKTDAFAWWMFRLLRAQPDDEFFDLFPGSGAVSRAWAQFSRQPELLQEATA